MTFSLHHHEQPEGVWYDKDETEATLEALEATFWKNKPAFESLAKQLRGPILERRWTSILGDDVSGRLPALVLGGIMERVARGREEYAPGRFFVAGVRNESDIENRKTQQYLHALKEQLGSRTLLVTEHIDTERTISNLESLLKAEGVEFDVASLSCGSENPEEYIKEVQKRFRDTKFYLGTTASSLGVGFWLEKSPTGVEKLAHRDEPTASRNFWADSELVHRAREMAGELADELYEKYFVNSEEEQTAKAA